MAGGPQDRAAFGLKSAEIGVAAFFFVLGAIVIYDSVGHGIGWQEVHGPQPGYFPFYIGLIICVSALVNLVRGLIIRPERDRTFVEVGQLKLVLTVLVPTAIFAGLVGWIGIYVSSIVFIAFFMRWLGKYPWWKAIAVSVATAVVVFLIFETWFKVPLPKGPVEAILRLN
ncbi:MAG: tripartite tricarboxylate transporter TctB family protein [Betaproteobacteria bacterium]|nr:MAG: tripartite tricarboxylate transporter TctB family protein [Betaproteobacteria bacterium]